MAESSTSYSRSVTNIFHWILHTFPNTNMINMLKWLNQIQETIYWAVSRQWAVPGANSDWGGPPHSCMPQVGVWGRAPSPWPQGDSRKWGYLRNWKYPQKVPALTRKHQISSNFTSFGTVYIGLSWPQCWGKRTNKASTYAYFGPSQGRNTGDPRLVRGTPVAEEDLRPEALEGGTCEEFWRWTSIGAVFQTPVDLKILDDSRGLHL